jgi:hypothetical protein
MSKLFDLKFLFAVVAIVEFFYAAFALLTPPSFVLPLTGWVLNADGQWIVKLMGASLAFQALIAWGFRKNPLLIVASALAFYQILAATIDWVMWISLLNEGIFSTQLSKITVGFSIFLHYLLGILLVIGILKRR